MVLGVDWGMSHFAAGLSQVTPEGVWCVVDEIAADVTHYHECRPLILAMLEKWIGPSKAPDIAGADRAVLSENQWLRNYFATSRLEVRTMMTREEQAIAQGISVAASMLDPAIGEPRLLFSDHLSRTTKGSTAPVIAALLAYRWTLNADGEITDIPLKDKVNDHAADWLRYALMATRDRPAFHGGRNLTLALAS